MAIIFCAKMSLIEINLAQRHIQVVFEVSLPVWAPKFGAQKIFQLTLFLMEYFGLIFFQSNTVGCVIVR